MNHPKISILLGWQLLNLFKQLALILFGTLSVAHAAELTLTSGKTMVRTDKDNAVEVAKFKEMRRMLIESNFIVRNGALASKRCWRSTSARASTGARSKRKPSTPNSCTQPRRLSITVRSTNGWLRFTQLPQPVQLA